MIDCFQAKKQLFFVPKSVQYIKKTLTIFHNDKLRLVFENAVLYCKNRRSDTHYIVII